MRGVAAVKVNIEEAERAWRKLPGHVLLIDERGVVILSTRDDLKYRPLAPLDAAQRAEVQRSRPYGEAPLEPLRWTHAAGAGARRAGRQPRRRWTQLASTRTLQRAAWRLVALDDMAPVRVAARYAADHREPGDGGAAAGRR